MARGGHSPLRPPRARPAVWLSLAATLALAPGARAQPQPPPTAPGELGTDIRPIEVDSEGSGPSRDAAISKALSNALAEQGGVSIGAGMVAATIDANGSGSVHTKGDSNAGIASVLPESMRTKQENGSETANLNAQGAIGTVLSGSGGRVIRYHVLSVTAAPEGGFLARVHAVLQLYQRQGGTAETRKRLALGSFTGDAPPGLAQGLYDQLVIDITQSRRFAVVDRTHDGDYADEIARLQSSDTAAAERSRVGQALGADYILTAKLHAIGGRVTGHAAHTETSTLELTGEVISHTTASTLKKIPGSATAQFQLIEVATRQIILADSSTITGNEVEALAQHITDELLNSIYPPRLVKADDPNDLIINRGGKLIHAGQRFRLMVEGTELFDPDTHESLGKSEHQAAVIEIGDIEPRMSHARLVAGALPAPGTGTVLRAEVVAPPPAAPPPKRRIVRRAAPPEPDNGLKLPFDH